MEEQRVVEVSLPNGATALARVRAIDGVGATKTSALADFDLSDVEKTLEGLAASIKSSLRHVAPSKVSVEVGLELALKAGKLTGLIVDGESKGSIAITMEWEGARLDG